MRYDGTYGHRSWSTVCEDWPWALTLFLEILYAIQFHAEKWEQRNQKMNPHASIKNMFLSNLQQWNVSCLFPGESCPPGLLMSGWICISIGSCQQSSPDSTSRSIIEFHVLSCSRLLTLKHTQRNSHFGTKLLFSFKIGAPSD